MSTSLMDQMIAAGVNIHNFQEVFDFYHNHARYVDNGGSGLTHAEVLALFNEWGGSKLDLSEFQLILPQLATKAEIQRHFRGVFVSFAALKSGVVNPQAGDYAHVDLGEGSDAQLYIWDATDLNWIGRSAGVISSTDSVTEGNTNLYFTTQRVLNVVEPILGEIDDLLTEILG